MSVSEQFVGGADGTDEPIGDRLQRRMIAESIGDALDATRDSSSDPESVGLIQVTFHEVEVDAARDHFSADDGAVLSRWLESRLPCRGRVVMGGADRFWLVLPGEPLLEALLIVDRMRELLGRECWLRRGRAVRLEVACGVAARRGADEATTELMAAAERSLATERMLEVRRHGPIDLRARPLADEPDRALRAFRSSSPPASPQTATAPHSKSHD